MYVYITDISTSLQYVATLLCESRKSKKMLPNHESRKSKKMLPNFHDNWQIDDDDDDDEPEI